MKTKTKAKAAKQKAKAKATRKEVLLSWVNGLQWLHKRIPKHKPRAKRVSDAAVQAMRQKLFEYWDSFSRIPNLDWQEGWVKAMRDSVKDVPDAMMADYAALHPHMRAYWTDYFDFKMQNWGDSADTFEEQLGGKPPLSVLATVYVYLILDSAADCDANFDPMRAYEESGGEDWRDTWDAMLDLLPSVAGEPMAA